MYTQELDERDARNARWLVLFVLISLLVHALLALAIILASIYLPKPKLNFTPQISPTVNLTLIPKPVEPPPMMARPFMPTSPQPNAPHKETQVESDNDTQLTSHSKADRANSLSPDVTGEKKRIHDLTDSRRVEAPKKQQQAQNAQQQVEQQQAKLQPLPTPPTPQTALVTPPAPAKAPPTEEPPSKLPPAPVDPNGLPVLPPISAPTLAPQSLEPRPRTQAAVPSPSLPSVASNLEGRAGISGEPSPEAMATEFGRYKAKVYRAVGARWYGKVDDQLSVLPVGIVRVQYTIHSDGTVETKVLGGGGDPSLELLLSISVNSIREAAPYDPFSDALRKQIGDSFTDEFSFSIYGSGE